MFVCVFNRNPNPWKDHNEIWHRGGAQGLESYWVGFGNVYPTPGLWGPKRGV